MGTPFKFKVGDKVIIRAREGDDPYSDTHRYNGGKGEVTECYTLSGMRRGGGNENACRVIMGDKVEVEIPFWEDNLELFRKPNIIEDAEYYNRNFELID